MWKTSKRCFCAFCRSPRRIYIKRHVSAVDAALALGAAVLLSVIVWQDLDPRTVVFFALGLGLAEIFIMLRWRLSIACPHCGFDPVLYKRAPDRAAAAVRLHLDARRASPLSVFAPGPRLPVVVKKSEKKAPDSRAIQSPPRETLR